MLVALLPPQKWFVSLFKTLEEMIFIESDKNIYIYSFINCVNRVYTHLCLCTHAWKLEVNAGYLSGLFPSYILI